jgi:hypothetical protein
MKAAQNANIAKPVKFYNVLIGEPTSCVGRLIVHEGADNAPVINVILAVHRDGARTRAPANHTDDRIR